MTFKVVMLLLLVESMLTNNALVKIVCIICFVLLFLIQEGVICL